MRAVTSIATLLVLAFAPSAKAQQPPIPVIDVHMHEPGAKAMPEYLSAMDELNVQKSILIGTPLQWEGGPGRPDRFLPSLMFPCGEGKAPNIGFKCFADGSEFPPVEEIRKLAEAGKLKALGEINAQYIGVAPDDPRLEPYYALAEELDLPVGIHIGIGPPGSAYVDRPGFPPRKSPKYSIAAGDVTALEKVLVRHPKLRLYVMHAAWPFREAMIYMLYMHPQLMVDVSVLQWAIPRPAYYSYLKDLVDAGFADRIMFGSDGGPKHLRAGVAAILAAPFLTDAQKKSILHDNAARFFKLPK